MQLDKLGELLMNNFRHHSRIGKIATDISE
jgi:hypothetical protein